MNFIAHLLTTLVAVSLSGCSVVQSPKTNSTFELLILHNNDMHAKFEQTSQLSGVCTEADKAAGKCYGGFARVAYLVKEARKAAATGEGPPVLYLNAGDTYTGSPWFAHYKWKIAAEFINALQPDAVSLGNHEFDNGVSGLTPFIRNITCPVLAANLILTKEPELEKEPNLMKSVVFDINGTRIGVVGYLTPETKFAAIKNNVEYIEEIEAIKSEISNLKKLGVEIFIGLGHSGFPKDLEIAKEVEDIDLIIGGHTNTFLWNGPAPDLEIPEGPYPTIVKQKSGRLVPVLQAYYNTKYLGNITLYFENGEIVRYEGDPILLDNTIPEDADVLKILKKYEVDIAVIANYIVGNATIILDSRKCQLRECNIGNLISDAMIEKYASEYEGEGWTDTPIAIIQGGAIRASIAHHTYPAEISKGELLTVMPFDGNMIRVTLNGSTILSMLEYSVANYDSVRRHGRFLQMSGMRVVYDIKKPPGKRVNEVYVQCGNCEIPHYEQLNMGAKYNVLMSSFLCYGGDGYNIFENLPKVPLNYNELECTTEYVMKHSPVYPGEERRIVFKHENGMLNSAITSSPVILLSFLMPLILILRH